ncbi:hypothetical protein CIHG_02648 [Coccidioides immitis H538.4]|uniref:Uncharacterized protein n=3 Tax=Coccidioides immitis TaxID=5501 RepID=A0A0J8R755_COCIT|nr:hypothetical protein CIRG_02974 [Coccidioides immitis RMSCC 2394]KMU80270.1 hypothetical protein CISG_08376 [Coccidioides immitis RMSCC 3703]KMU84864.1 hypothetical protein CIHG_02648 [Coccidioides immitis H538.4]
MAAANYPDVFHEREKMPAYVSPPATFSLKTLTDFRQRHFSRREDTLSLRRYTNIRTFFVRQIGEKTVLSFT